MRLNTRCHSVLTYSCTRLLTTRLSPLACHNASSFIWALPRLLLVSPHHALLCLNSASMPFHAKCPDGMLVPGGVQCRVLVGETGMGKCRGVSNWPRTSNAVDSYLHSPSTLSIPLQLRSTSGPVSVVRWHEAEGGKLCVRERRNLSEMWRRQKYGLVFYENVQMSKGTKTVQWLDYRYCRSR